MTEIEQSAGKGNFDIVARVKAYLLLPAVKEGFQQDEKSFSYIAETSKEIERQLRYVVEGYISQPTPVVLELVDRPGYDNYSLPFVTFLSGNVDAEVTAVASRATFGNENSVGVTNWYPTSEPNMFVRWDKASGIDDAPKYSTRISVVGKEDLPQ